MATQGMATESDIAGMARELGFALSGVAEAKPSPRGEYVRQWLSDNRHGGMGYLAEHVETRLDPDRLLPGARSVICVADRYPAEAPPPEAAPAHSTATGRIARYAWGDDYHQVIKKRLFRFADALRERWPEYDYRAAVDTAPVMEREHATAAGMGWIGKHTLLIHPRQGSWFLLGEIVTTMKIAAEHEPVTDHCGTCTRCIDACPTDCITPYQLDASRCISYLTIEHRELIDPALHEAMGDWVAGCDICQEVCPFNAKVSDGSAIQYKLRPPGPAIPLLAVLNWDAGARQAVLTKSALKRIKLEMWKRNAVIAAGNYLAKQDDAELRGRVEEIAGDESEHELVRATARQVLSR